jgi:hypothetical protein
MRATPTLVRSAASNFGLYPNASAPSNIYIDIGTKTTMNIICVTSGATANYAYQFFSNNQTDIFDLDAEL